MPHPRPPTASPPARPATPWSGPASRGLLGRPPAALGPTTGKTPAGHTSIASEITAPQRPRRRAAPSPAIPPASLTTRTLAEREGNENGRLHRQALRGGGRGRRRIRHHPAPAPRRGLPPRTRANSSTPPANPAPHRHDQDHAHRSEGLHRRRQRRPTATAGRTRPAPGGPSALSLPLESGTSALAGTEGFGLAVGGGGLGVGRALGGLPRLGVGCRRRP